MGRVTCKHLVFSLRISHCLHFPFFHLLTSNNVWYDMNHYKNILHIQTTQWVTVAQQWQGKIVILQLSQVWEVFVRISDSSFSPLCHNCKSKCVRRGVAGLKKKKNDSKAQFHVEDVSKSCIAFSSGFRNTRTQLNVRYWMEEILQLRLLYRKYLQKIGPGPGHFTAK